MGPSIQNVSKPRYAIRIAHAFTCSLMKSYSHFRCPVQWFGAHRTWGPRFIRLHPTTGYVAPRMTVVFHTVDCTDSVTVQTAHSFAHPAEHADTGSDPVKTFVLATWMYRYGQAVRIGYRQVHLRTTHLFGVSGRSWRQSIKTSLRSAYVRAYGVMTCNYVISVHSGSFRDGFRAGGIRFQSVSSEPSVINARIFRPLCAGFQYLLEVADQRLTVDVISPLHVLTRIGLLGPARREHDIAARSRLGCGCA